MPTLTLTVTLLVILPPNASVIVACSVYCPLWVNEATAFWAALVPLGLKATGAGGEPTVDQV